MPRSTAVSLLQSTRALGELATPLPVDELVPGSGPWEVEIGFGKGRYLLRRAEADRDRRFLGIEIASKYERLMVGRARRRGLDNWLSLRGEALYLLSAVLPRGFADVLHVYFPDPWPKARHQKRRLFDPESVDLVLGLLRPGGRLAFATDFLDYGETVRALLAAHPAVGLRELAGGWPEGPRTNYEAKYVEEGRPILRLEGTVDYPPDRRFPLHPAGEPAVLAATAPAAPDDPRGS
ncbi:MAG TPA: tRNA (guanosine(46)-N7)-methyltransferase TrmB [Thermoanaerobaculia bacterium]|nr:tRNA (guanosine(46)-N7)-methyltransferase TrmB [Thermoanaerobaculia bacterium]